MQDKVANSPDEPEEGGVIFGKGFGVIADMQVGPKDGIFMFFHMMEQYTRYIPQLYENIDKLFDGSSRAD